VAENDDGDVDRAEDGKLVSLLEETAFALQEGAARGQFGETAMRAGQHSHGAVPVVLDGLDLNLPATHGG
jgi:hypothetical protein